MSLLYISLPTSGPLAIAALIVAGLGTYFGFAVMVGKYLKRNARREQKTTAYFAHPV